MQFPAITAKANLSLTIYVALCMLCGEMGTYTYLPRFSIHKQFNLIE